MTTFRKSITLFLLDAVPEGRWLCELSNWTGIAYKIPRNKLNECAAIEELFSPGCYFLFGQAKDAPDRMEVYIGEAENVLERLGQQLKAYDFWYEAVVFVSKDRNLNKAHVKHLENLLYNEAKNACRYIVANTSTPTRSKLSAREEAMLEEFVFNIKLVTDTLGHKIFSPLISEGNVSSLSGDKVFSIITPRVKAHGMRTSDGFVLLKGAQISQKTTPSMPERTRLFRKEKEENRELCDWITQNDILFSSSSFAADFVLGVSASGPQRWKNKDGKTLKQIEEDEAATIDRYSHK